MNARTTISIVLWSNILLLAHHFVGRLSMKIVLTTLHRQRGCGAPASVLAPPPPPRMHTELAHDHATRPRIRPIGGISAFAGAFTVREGAVIPKRHGCGVFASLRPTT